MVVLVVVVAAAVVAAEQPPPPPSPQQQQRWDTYAAAMLGQGSDLHAASFNPDSFLAEAEEWCASTDRCEAFTYHLEPAVPAATHRGVNVLRLAQLGAKGTLATV